MKKLITLITLLFLSACSSTPDPTYVALTLNASSDLNPDHVDRPSPLVIKVIEISSVTSFENAEFFDLYNNAKSTLGSDFIAEEELILRPGDQKTVKLKLDVKGQYLAVIGAYQNIDDANWHYIYTVKQQKAQKIELIATNNAIVKLERVKKKTSPTNNNTRI
ncbi:type VI secretion system lipoprotein TssJ [Aliivibrio finisterrensis]|uniref:Type VI secretion system lipoprotein TssJ n=1 Tax=Aliivibrio finisterrensis TaxID=511998 RepID=A0A4Q5KNL9_9GAMM|nr:type VI secretion system lipoprotein TssJ [Aliivibrio finisterrensis]RYU47373.1 type VI secretion system lipoprotein TssJ [Aliivibrio finisterrensis]